MLGALQGAVAGGVLGALAAAIYVAISRWRQAPPGTAAVLGVVAALVVGGAMVGGLWRISLARCARILDRSLDGGFASHDRVISALWLSRAELTPFGEAAIRDAVARARRVAPDDAAPIRRPRGLLALGAGVLALGIAWLAPMPQRRAVAIGPVASSAPTEPRVRLTPRSLDPEREEALAAQQASAELADAELAKLAAELARTIKELSGPGIARGDALDRLADLERRAEETAAEAARLKEALARAGKALEESSATREAGLAVGAQDGAATEKALSELADKAANASSAERQDVAGALDKAGEGVKAVGEATEDAAASTAGLSVGDRGSQTSEDQERQRRLARDQPPAKAGAPTGAPKAPPQERRLQRLERELRQSSEACRRDPEACRQKLKEASRSLPRMEQEARSLAARKRLSAAVRQLKERLRRQGSGNDERRRAERKFQRSADGTPGEGVAVESSPGEGGEGDEMSEMGDDGEAFEMAGAGDEGSGMAAGEPGEGGGGEPQAAGQEGQGQGQAQGAGASGADPGQGTSPGQGIGNQPGDRGLGGSTPPAGARGREREARLRGTAGPKRSDVIQSAAQRGFAQTPYRGVFQDYQSVVEESLDATAVPPGRRYIVRRYFQLIRPRVGQSARAGKDPTAPASPPRTKPPSTTSPRPSPP